VPLAKQGLPAHLVILVQSELPVQLETPVLLVRLVQQAAPDQPAQLALLVKLVALDQPVP